ncbi:rho GTPase-activating protein 12-like [Seriola dumerili]|uniref:rho GTPase-activating protein 12-like n=1 Tax=Seriola dumerili TaxID=41447 RepID=UPI000BBE5550|nr:rho GTPase-activating protein 12-like [Seriola dumerili]
MATTSSQLGRGLGLVLVEFEYEYQGRDGVPVSIKPNERYVLLAKTNDHWWQVQSDCSSKPFYIPAKYVKELPADFPSPLDFADPLSPEPVLVPVTAPAPVPVPVPVPKTLEEPTRTKPGDEVTIRLRPDTSTGYRKTENRLSTFGVPLDFHDLSHQVVPAPWHPGNPPSGLIETGTSRNTNMANGGLSQKQPHLPGCLDDHMDSGKPRVPTFSPADPLSTARLPTQPIPVETPVVPVVPPNNGIHNTSSLTAGCHDRQESPIEPEEEEDEEEEEQEEEEMSVEESADEEADSTKEEESNHIYESIQDLNLDLEALVGGRVSPGAPPEPVPAPAPPPTQDHSSPGPNSPIYANVSSLKKTSLPQTSAPIPPPPSDPAPSVPDHTPLSSVSSSGMISPSSPLSPQEEWQPPLPEEDYPIDAPRDNDTVFTTPSHLPQRMMGNGVSEEGTNWGYSVAEDTLAPGHRRNVSDFTEVSNRRHSPDSPQLSDRLTLKRNLSNRSTGSHQLHYHLLEKAGITNKTKVADNGKKIRKNWSQSWTVLHGGILTFHKDPKSAPTGNASKASQIVPEYTVDLRGSSIGWASKDKSSKKNVLELRTRHGCEYLMQYDTESIISDWLKVIQDTIRQLEQEHLTEDEDEAASDKEDKDRKRTSTRTSSGPDSEQRRVRTKLRRFLQRRPTLQSVKEKGYIRDNVFGCHLDTLCHRENTTIPRFVEKCVRAVERRGLDVDGIYRVSGNLAVIQRLRHKADHEEQLDLEDGQWEEIHVITGALKLFLRELPEPLFPFSCFDKFIAAIQVPDHSLRVSYMKDLVRTLPLPNHDTMELLFKHLRRVIEHKDSNRMSVQSVAIVFGPTLLRPQTESANMTIHMVFQSQIVELMLNEFQNVFSQS